MRPIRFSNYVLCPNCGAAVLKVQILPNGRCRCLKCTHVFVTESRNPDLPTRAARPAIEVISHAGEEQGLLPGNGKRSRIGL
jgi:hypothetical protein